MSRPSLRVLVLVAVAAATELPCGALGAAEVMKHDDTRGSIAPGKLADVALVAGDPAVNISDIRKVELVVKDGVMYRSAELYRALGIER